MGTIFYKYREINDFLLDSLEKHYFYYSKPTELNDPFELNIHTIFSGSDNEIRNWCNNKKITNVSEVNRIIYEIRNGVINTRLIENHDQVRNIFLIYCMSSVWDESKLWAHYADSFKGLCLGFNTIYENNAFSLQLTNEDYHSKINIADKINFKEIILEVNYSMRKPIIYNPIIDSYDTIKQGIFSKEPKWSYEKEYRSVISVDNMIDTQKIVFNKNILKEIYFGCRTPKKDIQAVYSIIKATYLRNIKYYMVIINSNKMCLEKRIMSVNEME